MQILVVIALSVSTERPAAVGRPNGCGLLIFPNFVARLLPKRDAQHVQSQVQIRLSLLKMRVLTMNSSARAKEVAK